MDVWIVVDVRKSAPMGRGLPVKAYIEMDEGCGYPTTNAIGIYLSERDAENAIFVDSRNYKVVKTTLSYALQYVSK